MKNCCSTATERTYKLFLKTGSFSDNAPLSQYLKEITGERLPLVHHFLELVDLRVANTKPFVSALVKGCVCESCNQEIPLVVISSSLMLVLWRMQLLLISMVESVKKDHEKIRIGFRAPTNNDTDQLRECLDLYLGNVEPVSDNLGDLLNAVTERMSKELIPFMDAVILGEVWVFLHEIAHAFIKLGDDEDLDVWPAYPNLSKNASAQVEQISLTPMFQHLWRNELLADLMATSLLLFSLFHKESKWIVTSQDKEFVAGLVLAGVAAAANTIQYIAMASAQYRRKMPEQRRHPPLELRIELVSRFVVATMGLGSESNRSIRRFSDAIGIVGGVLYETCGSSWGKE